MSGTKKASKQSLKTTEVIIQFSPEKHKQLSHSAIHLRADNALGTTPKIHATSNSLMKDEDDDANEYNCEEDSSSSDGEVDDATLFAVIYLINCYIYHALRCITLL